MDERSAMVGNNDDSYFDKLDRVPADSIEAKLFSLIDDIDTGIDMFKPEIENYEKFVMKKIFAAHALITSDGHNLYYNSEQIEKKYSVAQNFTDVCVKCNQIRDTIGGICFYCATEPETVEKKYSVSQHLWRAWCNAWEGHNSLWKAKIDIKMAFSRVLEMIKNG
ncbi:MAG: hypothetical protein GY804_08725 [Alphaproteobacteria bacterium]|nr:hypothetical protein [Alphaproteobacteria bacterium]